MAAFLHLASDYAESIGFEGTLLIEPKPMEPTTHQYDYDAATTIGFLREFDLFDRFKLNIESNHATLAAHTWEHDLMVASIAGRLGSIDINRGDLNLGWDTDQFPTDLSSATMAMLVVLDQGGLGDGGLNFDAKLRRGSFDNVDLFHAHIGGMDTFARALLVAQKMRDDGVLSTPLAERYAGFRESELGQKILARKTTFVELEETASAGEPARVSGRQEALENMVNARQRAPGSARKYGERLRLRQSCGIGTRSQKRSRRVGELIPDGVARREPELLQLPNIGLEGGALPTEMTRELGRGDKGTLPYQLEHLPGPTTFGARAVHTRESGGQLLRRVRWLRVVPLAHKVEADTVDVALGCEPSIALLSQHLR